MEFDKNEIKQLKNLFLESEARQDKKTDKKFQDFGSTVDKKFQDFGSTVDRKFSSFEGKFDKKLEIQRREIYFDTKSLLYQEIKPLRQEIKAMLKMESEDIAVVYDDMRAMDNRVKILEGKWF